MINFDDRSHSLSGFGGQAEMFVAKDSRPVITKEAVKALASEAGFDACGITVPDAVREAERALRRWVESGKHGEMKYLEDFEARKERFWKNFPEAKSVIVLGVNYYSPGETKANGRLRGRVARYAWGRDYHKVIREKLGLLEQKICERAGRAVRFEQAVDTQPLLERSLGERAGLGFRGKQTQLLSLQFGPWLVLAELVTDLELECDEPFRGSCGTCRVCIDECPTQAIDEAGHIDARRCISYLTIEHKSEIPLELRPKMGNWVFGCDLCLSVCPYTAKQRQTPWNEFRADAGFGSEIDLPGLFDGTSSRAHGRKFEASAMSRANRKQLLRNACVALGNSGSKEAIPVLEKARHDPSELVREHAEWALEQIVKSEPAHSV